MLAEEHRTRLIGEIARVLRDECVPEEARAAGLVLIGWLARRMPGETAHALGVEEMRVACAQRESTLEVGHSLSVEVRQSLSVEVGQALPRSSGSNGRR